MLIIAHNIRSLHNVGSIYRSADCFGIERIYLTGFTGTPPRSEIAKTALGAEDRVQWEHHADPAEIISTLKADGYVIVALDNTASSEPLIRPAQDKLCLILGNEVAGIEPDVLALADRVMEIAMPGRKQSLNVSVAAGIAMFVFSQKMA